MLLTLRRAALAVVAFQAAVWLLMALLGFATSPLSSGFAATQLPGIWLLTELGWCCGIGGGFVLSDVIVNRWGGLTPAGAPVLALANTVALLAVVLPVAAAWVHVRARWAAG